MADFGDKNFDPTPHRRQLAREQGQVARSQDLGTAGLLLVMTLMLLVTGAGIIQFCGEALAQGLGGEAWLQADGDFLVEKCLAAVKGMVRSLMPLWGVALVAGVAVHLLQVGFLFLPAQITPDLSRISPGTGLKRIFSSSSLVRLGQGFFKLVVALAIGGWIVSSEWAAIGNLSTQAAPEIARYLGELVIWTILKIGGALLLLALADYGWQRWRHEQSLKMTQHELREELKNVEGDPQVASRRRAAQRQLAAGRAITAVPQADMILSTADGVVVALRYATSAMHAPVLVAKAAGPSAQKMLQLATAHGVPVLENPLLARRLYEQLELARPVPPVHYQAVAELLAQAYELRKK